MPSDRARAAPTCAGPDEAQTWLVNTEINAGVTLRDWVKPTAVRGAPRDVKSLTVKIPGKEDVNIELVRRRQRAPVEGHPRGHESQIRQLDRRHAEAASSIDFDDVKKLDAPPTGDKVSTVTLNLANGLKCDFKIRRDGGVAWVTLEASGEGEAKKEADELTARAKGWEFEIPKSKADAILKTRDELLEKAAS